jgi:ATP-dependent Zn protease
MGNVSPGSQELVDSETRRLVQEAEETAVQVLKLNAKVLEELANSLLETETLSGPALDVYLEAVVPWPRPLLDSVNGRRPPVRMRAHAAESVD